MIEGITPFTTYRELFVVYFTVFFKNALPKLTGNFLVDGVLQLDSSASSVDDYYKGWWIWWPNAFWPVSGKITSYNGTTKQFTVQKLICVKPEYATVPKYGTYYELSDEVYDNYKPLDLGGIEYGLAHEIFTVKLLCLTLPLTPLFCGHGNDLRDYPVVYVQLSNSRAILKNNGVITNTQMQNTFIVPVNTPSAVVRESLHFRLVDCYMELNMRLDLNQTLYLVVYLNTGEVLKFADDQMSPNPPTDLYQVTATFQLTKNCEKNKCSEFGKRTVKLINEFH
jgi:hypothetical protein